MTQPLDPAIPTGEEVPVSKPPAKTEAASKAADKPAAPAAVAAKAAPAPAPATAAKPAVKSAVSKPGNTKPSAKTAPQNQAPTTAPSPYTNRFTDRFAPAAPASRPMTETADIPKSTHKADPKLVNAWKTKAGRDLTVEELLAMPESEYMNDKQLDFFRAQLQKQKDDLLSNAGETTEHLREDTSIVPDPADRATIEEEHALELRTRDRERKLLKKIAQSLGRLESGDYGFCDETGEPIGLARLLARPTATLSLEAQQRRELKQKMFGD
jgi:DnaK suppressor protein